MPTTECEYQLRIPSETDNLELIRDFVSKVAEKVGFKSDDVGKIELACDEACTNVMKHAYASGQKNGKESLDILIQIDYDKFTLVVTDHGRGFDPDAIKLPDMKEYLAQLKVGGLGIYLMKTLMDEVDYQMQPGVRNQVKMVKYFIDKKNSKLIESEKENK
ncbi:ATP-binding protein [candidate division KSB1 bacterium]|nr:ATP-binding protein [candidate division KSB1 bacterium]RQW07132.1 MAG: ATP-binding protein [candidate division KSB1 bacterium]